MEEQQRIGLPRACFRDNETKDYDNARGIITGVLYSWLWWQQIDVTPCCHRVVTSTTWGMGWLAHPLSPNQRLAYCLPLLLSWGCPLYPSTYLYNSLVGSSWFMTHLLDYRVLFWSKNQVLCYWLASTCWHWPKTCTCQVSQDGH